MEVMAGSDMLTNRGRTGRVPMGCSVCFNVIASFLSKKVGPYIRLFINQKQENI